VIHILQLLTSLFVLLRQLQDHLETFHPLHATILPAFSLKSPEQFQRSHQIRHQKQRHTQRGV